MAWATPSTFTGETVDENDLNQVSSNETYLYKRVQYGSYVGCSSGNFEVAHNMTRVPQMIWAWSATRPFVITSLSSIIQLGVAGPSILGIKAPNATSFYVGNSGNYTYSANLSGTVYGWVAIG